MTTDSVSPEIKKEQKSEEKPKKVAVDFSDGTTNYEVGKPFTRPKEMSDLMYNGLVSSGKIVDA